jgi:SAM-dependent methyltransferase
MPDWEEIFKEKGYVFVDPHQDISRISTIFHENNVKRIMDLGCGTGRHLVFLAQEGFDVSGFDSSETALELAKKWLEEESLEADIRHSRMEEPFPYADGEFDAVISIQVIHHNLIQDILTTLNEIERVLKIGGYIFITVPILGPKPDNPEDDWQLDWVEEGTYIPQSGPESGIPHHYFTEGELQDIFGNFMIIEMYMDDTNHRCILAVKQR